MLSNAARFLLIVTSVAPVSVVYGASLLPDDWRGAGLWVGVAALATFVCVGVLKSAAKHVEQEALVIGEAESQDSEVLAFLVAYALPLVARDQAGSNVWALVAFLLIMVVVLIRCNIYHVNPLLGLLGFHFYKAKATSGTTYLVVTKRPRPPTEGQLTVVLLSPFLALEV